VHVRSILGNIGVLVLPDQVAIGKADQAFDSSGNLTDQVQQTAIIQLSRKLVTIVAQLNP
jgi:chromate reductase, NAD(P)H dehydrogenase (quinone)